MESSTTVTLPLAFLAGLVSFITPCVLPLVPIYLSILSGSSFEQLTGKGKELSAREKKDMHKRVMINAIAFILGFTIVFMVLGLVAGSLGDWLEATQSQYGAAITNYILWVFGVVLVILGLNMAGIWKPMFLNTEARFQLQKGKWGFISSGLVGAAFAFGWTPCIGPILAPILAIAAESGSKWQGAVLLLSYSLGLGVPFFLSALSINGLIAFTNKMKHHFHTMEVIVGSILIIFGLSLHLLGVYGNQVGGNGIDIMRARLSWLDKYTSPIEESLTGEQVDESVAPDGITPIDEEADLVTQIQDSILADGELAALLDEGTRTFVCETEDEGVFEIYMTVETREQHDRVLEIVMEIEGVEEIVDYIEIEKE